MFKIRHKSTFSSAMETEIYEQPRILSVILKKYIGKDNVINIDVPKKIDSVVLVASGSSYHCARFAADLFGEVAHLEARAIYSSEFLLKPKVPDNKKVLYIFITQSGETSDTVRAAKKAKQLGVNVLCITNKEHSTMWDVSDYQVNCFAGEEKSIAATKSFTAQLICALLITLKYAQINGIDVDEYLEKVKTLPSIIDDALAERDKTKQLARLISKFKSLVITADGLSYALAKEMSLKIKETSYLNINANILGEFMHGHVAVLNSKCALVYISAVGVSYGAAKNLEKIKNDYNPSIFIIGKASDRINPNFNINVNCEDEILKMFANAVVIQLLALDIAKRLHRNVDKPKGLKKVVVEN